MLLLTLILAQVVSRHAAADDSITIVGEPFPPLQFKEGSDFVGQSIDIVKKLLAQTGVQGEIELYPWARAFHMAQTKKNVLLISVARNQAREKKFKWVGEISNSKSFFWTLKSNPETVNVSTYDELKHFKIVTQRYDHLHDYLLANGFDREIPLTAVTNKSQAIKMLYAGRVDYILGSEIYLKNRISQLGLDPTLITPVLPVNAKKSGLYLAFSPQTSDALVERFQLAFKSL